MDAAIGWSSSENVASRGRKNDNNAGMIGENKGASGAISAKITGIKMMMVAMMISATAFLTAGENTENTESMMPVAQVEQVGNSLSQWTQNNGLAVVLLFLVLISLGIAAWKTLNWSAANVVIPMRDSIITHLTNTDKTMDSMRDSLEGMHREMTDNKNLTQSIHSKLDKLVPKN